MSVGSADLLLEAEGAAQASVAITGGEIAARSPGELFWRRFRADKVAVFSLGLIVVLVLAAIFAPLLVTLVGASGPNVQNPHALDQFGTPTGPSRHALWPFIVALGGLFAAGILGLVPQRRARHLLQGGIVAVTLGLAAAWSIGLWRYEGP